MSEDQPTSGGGTHINGDQVGGDKVAGDKLGGDKVGGNKIVYMSNENVLPPEAEQALAHFKRAVHEGDVAGAEQALQALKAQQSAFPHLWQPVESAEALYRILTADAGADLAELFDQIPEDWAAEAAAAFVYVCKRPQVFTVRQLREAYKHLRLGQIKDEELLAEVECITQKWVSDQPLQWPIHQLRLPFRFAPFKHGDASNPAELAALFGRSAPGRRAAFWSEHPLFNALSQAQTLQVICGEEGSGRTALGLALGKYVTGLQLSLYVAGLPDDARLLEGYAGRLMDVIRYLPARLILLTTADYKLLAELLCTGLGKQLVLGDLRNAQVDPAPGSEPGQAFIRQLVQYVVDADSKDAMRTSWPRVVSALARRLRFEGIRLVIDSADTDPTRLNSDLFARFERWQDNGLVTLVFAPQAASQQLPVQPLQLEWTYTHLREMVNHRYQSAVGPTRAQIESRFDSSETFQHLLAVSHYNPRRFMAFWRMLEQARPGREETFDAAFVKRVCGAA
jgi:hypothetical protein